MARLFDRLSKNVQYGLAILASGITGYEIWNYSGIYRGLADLELQYFGQYEIKITFLLAFVCWFLVLGLIALLVSSKQSTLKRDSSNLPNTFELVYVQYKRSLGFAVVALTLFILGGYEVFLGFSSGAKRVIDLQQVEQGNYTVHPPEWWSVSAKLLLHEDSSWEKNHTTYHYIPAVSEAWRSGDPVALVVEVVGTQYNSLRSKKIRNIEGLIKPSGIPSDVRAAWNSNVGPIGENTVLLEFEGDPQKEWNFGLSTMGVGVFFAILALILWHRDARANKSIA